MNYKNTQIGYLIIFTFILTTILFTFILTKTNYNIYLITLTSIILLLILSFSTLTTTINNQNLKIKFGYGIFQKQFPLKNIASVKTVKNHWYYGWGIRYWLWPKMWIFNVSGFKAIEIILKNNKRYRIGTNKPQELKNAIAKAIQ